MNIDGDLAALTTDPLPYFTHRDPAVRRLAVSVAATDVNSAGLRGELRRVLLEDESPRVRAEAAEVLAGTGPTALNAVLEATNDPDPVVVEAAATGLGEIGDPIAVPWLLAAAAEHQDRLVREAAVAALGAIGDERARVLLLELVAKGPPQIRRRSVVALSVFDGEDVEGAIRGALSDRNPMVREAAEMIAGRPLPPE